MTLHHGRGDGGGKWTGPARHPRLLHQIGVLSRAAQLGGAVTAATASLRRKMLPSHELLAERQADGRIVLCGSPFVDRADGGHLRPREDVCLSLPTEAVSDEPQPRHECCMTGHPSRGEPPGG